MDVTHPDFEGKIWVNEDEIPNNNVDDDNNGYIDDIHGWSYLGSTSGENINYENYEYVRILKKNDENHPMYNEAKTMYDEEYKKRKGDREYIQKLEENLSIAKNIIKENTSVEVNSKKDLEKVSSNVEQVQYAKEYLSKVYDTGFTEEGLASFKNRTEDFLKYYLNKNYNPRKTVGDDPLNIEDRNYGNPDVTGPASSHGTSVAGVIAANRDNGIGINGVATDVKIMALRVVPNGDERDKDIALAIRYAVDNGAEIINMSFGKKFSPEKKWVDEAVKYAEEHDVLLVHAAGNEGSNIDVDVKYPSNIYSDGTTATNWINVGASDATMDIEIAAVFSNYGKENVDVFAPGVNIISLDTNNTYDAHNGTSLAAPVVSGVAALLLSYYPDLTAKDLKSIITETSFKVSKPKKIYQPGLGKKKRTKVKFSELSNSGGVVNAYNALIEAEKRSK